MVCRSVADHRRAAYRGVRRHAVKRKEPVIYVANWFFLAFIGSIAMLHVVNNLAIPISIWSSQSVIPVPRASRARWWCNGGTANAVGFF